MERMQRSMSGFSLHEYWVFTKVLFAPPVTGLVLMRKNSENFRDSVAACQFHDNQAEWVSEKAKINSVALLAN